MEFQLIKMAIGMGLLFAENAAADAAETAADRINSREWNRAVRVAQSQRADALHLGATQAGRISQQGTMVEGAQAVGYAAAGVDSASGTAAGVGRTTRLYAELDAATTRNNARRQALGFDQTIAGLYDQAERMKAEREARQTARAIKSASTVLDLIPSGGALSAAAGGGGG